MTHRVSGPSLRWSPELKRSEVAASPQPPPPSARRKAPVLSPRQMAAHTATHRVATGVQKSPGQRLLATDPSIFAPVQPMLDFSPASGPGAKVNSYLGVLSARRVEDQQRALEEARARPRPAEVALYQTLLQETRELRLALDRASVEAPTAASPESAPPASSARRWK